jgi:hypothetical protein
MSEFEPQVLALPATTVPTPLRTRRVDAAELPRRTSSTALHRQNRRHLLFARIRKGADAVFVAG